MRRRRRWPPTLGRGGRAPSPTAPRPTPTTAWSTSRAAGAARRFDAHATPARSSARSQLPVAGAHNARNAAAALVAGLELGAPFDAARAALARFAGVARRFEYRGEVAGVTFIDDYAHLPTEVAARSPPPAAAAGSGSCACSSPTATAGPRRSVAEFADAFGDADLLVVTDIYPAGEAPRPGVSGKLVVQAVLDAHPWRRLAYLPRRPDVVGYLGHELRPGDLCLTLGAGDLTSLPDEVQERLHHRRPSVVIGSRVIGSVVIGQRRTS